MEKKIVLHILRNPYGYPKGKMRLARLKACDTIENLEKEVKLLHTALHQIENINCGHDGDCGVQNIIDSVL